MNFNSKISIGSFIIAISIVTSRILGIFREILIANIAGSGIQKTAYELAFTLPDILNHFVSTGFLSLSFIPIFTELKNKNNLESHHFFCNVLNSFGFLILIVGIIIWIFITPLLSWFIPENLHSELLSLTTYYSRIILPAQLFFFTGAIFTAVQHYYLRFLIPCFIGLIYNLSIIVGGLITGKIEGFVWGVLIGSFLGGGVLQGWSVFKSLRTPYLFYFDPLNINFKKYLFLSIPLVLGIGPFFSLELLYRYYGNFLGINSVSYLSYSYRMMIICVSVTAFATGIASYPYISKMFQQKKIQKLQSHLITTLLRVYGNLTPLAIIIWFYSSFIVKIILERGEFSPSDTQIVSNLLQHFIFCVFGLGGYVILIRYFYGCKKMWYPMFISIIITLFSLPFYNFSITKWGVSGIPIISSITVSILFLTLILTWFFIFPSLYWKNFLKKIFKWAILSVILASLAYFFHFFIKLENQSIQVILILCILESLFLYFTYSYLSRFFKLPHILNSENT